MKDLEFYLICPTCYGQDHLSWEQFNYYVLAENPENRLGVERPRRMEGEYPCPYGCKSQMLVFAIGTEEEVNKKSDELHEKYPTTKCI